MQGVAGVGEKIKEYVMPDDLLESVADYTLKVAENDGPLYSTTEVKDYVDKKMGWNNSQRSVKDI